MRLNRESVISTTISRFDQRLAYYPELLDEEKTPERAYKFFQDVRMDSTDHCSETTGVCYGRGGCATPKLCCCR
jgi:hypothetical protein